MRVHKAAGRGLSGQRESGARVVRFDRIGATLTREGGSDQFVSKNEPGKAAVEQRERFEGFERGDAV